MREERPAGGSPPSTRRQRGQNTWPPPRGTPGHQRAVSCPPMIRISWPPTHGVGRSSSKLQRLCDLEEPRLTARGDGWPVLTDDPTDDGAPGGGSTRGGHNGRSTSRGRRTLSGSSSTSSIGC